MGSSDNVRYKREAGLRLRQCWGECVGEVIVESSLLMLAAVLFMAVKYAAGGLGRFSAVVEAVYILAAYAAYVPLRYGTAWFYIQQAKDTSVPASGFFSCYMHKRHIKGTLLLELEVLARIVPASAIPLSYVAFAAYLGNKISYTSETAAAVFISCAVLIGTVIVYIYILFIMKYAFVPFLYAACHDFPPKEIISRSKSLMKGHRTNIIRLIFSLLPLWISCAAVFPVFFVVPYTKMTFARAAAEIFYHDDVTFQNENTGVFKEDVLV